VNDDFVIDAPLIRKTALGLFILLLFSGACAWLLKEPFIRMGEVFLDRFGLLGLFVGTIIADSSPLPLTHEPLTFIGIAAGIPTPTLLLTITSASILSGPVGWTCGRLLVADTAFAEWLERRYPGFMGVMRRNGLKAVAIAALLPVPFSLATWTAGMLRLPFHKVAAISLLRIVKVWVYFQILKLGWLAGGG
jgi:membrane protein YqaA with SNARE-associated domain